LKIVVHAKMRGTPFAFPREGNGYGTYFTMNTAWFLEDLMKNDRFTTLGKGLHATPLKQQMLCMSHQKFFLGRGAVRLRTGRCCTMQRGIGSSWNANKCLFASLQTR
jgi:hypothetical protein